MKQYTEDKTNKDRSTNVFFFFRKRKSSKYKSPQPCNPILINEYPYNYNIRDIIIIIVVSAVTKHENKKYAKYKHIYLKSQLDIAQVIDVDDYDDDDLKSQLEY